MAIAVHCQSCGGQFRAAERDRGNSAPCTRCGVKLRIEGPAVPDYDVFVSHSSKDKTAADAVVAALESAKIRCWVAPRDITPGADWGASIIDAIGNCRVMVLVYTERSNESRQVHNEVERAFSKSLTIIPLRLEATIPSKNMEYFISRAHWLDAMTPPLEKHLAYLVGTVRGIVGQDLAGSTNVGAMVAPVPAPPRPRSRAGLLVALLSLIAIATAGWIFRGEIAHRLDFMTAVGSAPRTEKRNSPAPAPIVTENSLAPASPNAAKAPPPLATEIPLAPAPSTAPAMAQIAQGPLPPPPAPAPPPPVPAKTPEELALERQQRDLAALKALFLSDHLTADQYQLGQSLLKPPPGTQDEYDAGRRAQFAGVLEGTLAPEKLSAALTAIETPQQKAARLAREEAQRNEAARQKQIAGMLASARTQTTAERQLALAEQVLGIDPSNAEAKKLKAADEEVLSAAATKRVQLSYLLQQARAAGLEDAQKGLAAVTEALRLDASNAEALKLKKNFDAYLAKNYTNTLGMKFIRIEPGEFDMGSPAAEVGRIADRETLHHVKLTKPFMMGVHHVTRGQFATFINDDGYKTDAEKGGKAFAFDGTKFTEVAGASWRNTGFDQTDDHPVVEVSWNDAVAFCQWLTKKEHKRYRLPTEAEWEYACRAGSQKAYFWGDDTDAGQGYANCADLTAKDKFPDWRTFNWRDGFVFTSPVGSFKPNKFGLYDMIGNAWEWCSDYYGAYPAGDAVDPTGPTTGDAIASRVLRGGSWHSDLPRYCRCACRTWFSPGDRYNNFGFRVCLDF